MSKISEELTKDLTTVKELRECLKDTQLKTIFVYIPFSGDYIKVTKSAVKHMYKDYTPDDKIDNGNFRVYHDQVHTMFIG